ncbi:hypothetical protein R3P38DRAFT_3304025 [Favolaschia claudopus]|uniref:Splicing factor YJU2 n=1 Tax=Favolaschia claudopus TaxID=2862362 RepID=A0AAW0E045_9AGAR
MAERKVLNKYFPPDFDPDLIPRRRGPKNSQQVVRLMAPFSMRCNTCGEYIYKGKKFNARKETVDGEDYYGIKIFRFYIKCTLCSAEITFKTDPKNTDYAAEHGASRNFEPWREEAEVEENRTTDSKREMDILDALQDIRARNARNERVGNATSVDLLARIGIEELENEEDLERKRIEEEDEKLVREVFAKVPMSASSSSRPADGGDSSPDPPPAVITVKRKADDVEPDLLSLLPDSARSLISAKTSALHTVKKAKVDNKKSLGIVNKNVTRWGKEWFERELTTISITGKGTEVVSISSVTDVDGDVELGQRKSKLITIFDCKVVCAWTGTTSDGTEVKGTLTIPEVSHEITLDGLSDYVYNWSLTTPSSPEVDAIFSLAKSRIPTALEAKFAEFAAALVDTHGRDLTVSGDPSRSATPNPAASTSDASAGASAAAPAAPKPVEKKSNVNTTKITVEGSFMAAADDLFGLLTDEKRIPTWTRAAAQSAAKVDTEYSLFGGGVKGKYVSLTPPTEIVQTWALQSPTWPSGHYATLTTTIAQGSDSSTVTFVLNGVPTGMEDEIKRNIEGYYIQGFKSIGLGSSLS